MSLDSLVHRIRPAAGEPDGALVLLHGRGTDEHDLFPLLDMLDPERRLVGVTARGPLTLPPGGAHWYVVREIGYPDRETFHASFERTAGWLDALPEAIGVPIERTVLGGFSQGGVVSYALALGRGRPAPAGIIALSSFIPTVEGFELDLDDRTGFRVAIGHGTYDPIIGVEWGRRARERLEAAGASVTYRESPMGHAIDPDYVEETLVRWLSGAVAAAPSAREASAGAGAPSPSADEAGAGTSRTGA
jgi:phospholipase/carboxylesterase